MKYSVTGSKPAVQAKAFDFDAAIESIAATYAGLADAYEQLIAAEGRCAEAADVMEDCTQALESIQKFGVSQVTMAVFNSENGLDQALGLESLDLEAVESMSESARKLAQSRYEAGLEGKIGEAWAKFVQFLKDLWEKVKRWFRELFDSNAKYVRLVTEAKKEGKFAKANYAGKSTISGITPDQANKCLDAAEALLTYAKAAAVSASAKPEEAKLTAVGLKVVEGGKIDASGLNEAVKKESKRAEELKWGAQVADSVAARFEKCSTGADAKKAVADIDKGFKDMIAGAEKVKKDAEGDEAKKKANEELEAATKARKEGLGIATSCMAAYKKLVDRVGTTLVALSKLPAAEAAK